MDDRRAMVNFAVHARLRAIQRRLLLGPTCGRPVLEAARHDNARKGGLIVATVIVTGADRGIDAALVRNYHRRGVRAIAACLDDGRDMVADGLEVLISASNVMEAAHRCWRITSNERGQPWTQQYSPKVGWPKPVWPTPCRWTRRSIPSRLITMAMSNAWSLTTRPIRKLRSTSCPIVWNWNCRRPYPWCFSTMSGATSKAK